MLRASNHFVVRLRLRTNGVSARPRVGAVARYAKKRRISSHEPLNALVLVLDVITQPANRTRLTARIQQRCLGANLDEAIRDFR